MKAKAITFLLVILMSACVSKVEKNESRIHKGDGQVIPDMSWLNQKDGPRPKYVWENREDYMYHERYYPDSAKMTTPEIYAIMRCPWVFNRAMKWVRNPDGTIIAYSDGGDLMLTGENQVSGWYSDPQNKITNVGDETTFEKKSAIRRRDCAVLPSFQFHLSQHPVLEVSVAESTDEWQFVASIKGRSGAPFISSGWQTGAKTIRFNIADSLKKRGFNWNYAELHFAIGTWAQGAESKSTIRFKSRLIARPAIIASLPVIRTIQNSAGGVPVSAVITGTKNETSRAFAKVNGQKYEMIRNGDVWTVLLKRLPIGSYLVEVAADKPEIATSTVLVRITDSVFWKHDKDFNSLSKKGVTTSPLTGSFQGTFFFKEVGLASEQIVNSQTEWNNWNKTQFPGEHQHYWESLKLSELNSRFAYLEKNGWDMVFLHSHYGIWERFDASGNLAPHGVEQFANYVDQAAKNNLNVEVALSSYPYGNTDNKEWTDGTKPYLQTLEKGFKNEDWRNPENEPFRTIYHQYIKDFIGTFKDETSIAAFSSSGEGDADQINGIKRFLDTKEVIRSIDTSHIIVSEPIHIFGDASRLPLEIAKGFESDLIGCRGYTKRDEELSMFLRLSQPIPNLYIGEGCWPSSNVYTKFTTTDEASPDRNCWVGNDEYRHAVRDLMYIGFVNRMPLTMSWDEKFTEDEHLVISQARKLINWNQSYEKASVVLLIPNKNLNEMYPKLLKFEKLFSHLAVDYRMAESASEAKLGDWVIDSSLPFDSLKYSKPINLPEYIQEKRPFNLSFDYGTQFCISSDRKTMAAYVYNKKNYESHQYVLTGNLQRLPTPALFELNMLNITENLNYRLYDLDSKTIVKEGKTNRQTTFKIDNTKADYLLMVYP